MGNKKLRLIEQAGLSISIECQINEDLTVYKHLHDCIKRYIESISKNILENITDE